MSLANLIYGSNALGPSANEQKMSVNFASTINLAVVPGTMILYVTRSFTSTVTIQTMTMAIQYRILNKTATVSMAVNTTGVIRNTKILAGTVNVTVNASNASPPGSTQLKAATISPSTTTAGILTILDVQQFTATISEVVATSSLDLYKTIKTSSTCNLVTTQGTVTQYRILSFSLTIAMAITCSGVLYRILEFASDIVMDVNNLVLNGYVMYDTSRDDVPDGWSSISGSPTISTVTGNGFDDKAVRMAATSTNNTEIGATLGRGLDLREIVSISFKYRTNHSDVDVLIGQSGVTDTTANTEDAVIKVKRDVLVEQ